VASYPCYGSPASISDAADKALYLAKNRGRNLVVLAD
jgi:PleD family two-component response regulator